MEPMNAPAAPPEPRRVAAGRGADWIGEGFALFRQQPGVWIGILLIWLVLSSILSSIPVLNVVGSFLNPIFTAGIMLGAASQARQEGLRLEHLFAGFRSGRVGALLMVTVWTLILAVAALLVLVVIAWPIVGSLHDGSPGDWLETLGWGRLLLTILGLLVLGVIVGMAVWFAPALIVFHGLGALDALKLSFRGCTRNWLALTIYGLLAIVILVVAAVPLLLGLLIALPVLFASGYISYRDIFAA
jgi:uncharacterized membrane protein